MSQERHSRQGASTASRSSSVARTRSIESRTPSPHPSYLQKQDSNHELVNSEDDSISSDSTSLLGSMWNLVRDARELAAKELDKLLEHFPYKNTSGVRDQTLSVKKPTPKSLLGHGPPVKQRTYNSKRKSYSFTKMLLDKDLKDHVNDVTPQNQYKALSSTTDNTSRNNRQSTTRRHTRHHSGINMVQQEHLQQSKRTPSLKRDLSQSSQSSLADRYNSIREPDDWGSTSESQSQSQYNGEDTDNSEYFQVGSRRIRLSRENSPTPSIASITGTLSISGHTNPRNYYQPHSHSRQGSSSNTRIRFPRYSLLGEPLDNAGNSRTSSPIYPEPSLSRKESLLSSKSPSPPYPSAIANVDNTPFLDSRESSPLPSINRTSPELKRRTSVQSNLAENDKLSELQQELAVIKQQLASLVSARKEDMERANLSPGPSAPPPPPPPPSSLATPKKWSPPHSAASLSMQNVLKELSSSKVQLRKTGSPFISRISSAVESSPSSKYTSLSIRSKDIPDSDLDAIPRSPLANIKRLIKKPQAIKNDTLTRKNEPSAEIDLGISWPSTKTLEEADSRLDKAAKNLTDTNSRKSTSTVSSRSRGSHKGEYTEEPEPQPSEISHTVSRTSSAPEGKRKWNGINILGESDASEVAHSPKQLPSIFDFNSQDRSGPQLSGNKKLRPTMAQSPTLHRSMTDPIQLTSQVRTMSSFGNTNEGKRVSFQPPADGKEHERLWFLESDTDNWRVGN
ncbi:hypothetical protein BGZ76_009799 [Entomortierella beljakovae]|nr:hypothetical protein BGZ76_009799 [Entomortierella beljakovae]